MSDDKTDDGLEDDGGDREQERLFDHHPEGVASEQELEVTQADKTLHRLVQGRQMDRIDGRIDHQAGDDCDQRQCHQKRDRRLAAREFLQRELPARYGYTEVAGYDVSHPYTPFSLTPKAATVKKF